VLVYGSRHRRSPGGDEVLNGLGEPLIYDARALACYGEAAALEFDPEVFAEQARLRRQLPGRPDLPLAAELFLSLDARLKESLSVNAELPESSKGDDPGGEGHGYSGDWNCDRRPQTSAEHPRGIEVEDTTRPALGATVGASAAARHT
jgi:hypothetical protein